MWHIPVLLDVFCVVNRFWRTGGFALAQVQKLRGFSVLEPDPSAEF